MSPTDTQNQHPPQPLESLEDFIASTHTLIQHARRSLTILSHQLDPLVYDRDDTVALISGFCRQSRDMQVRILVRDSQALAERGHKLAKLHQRLPSKVQLRKLTLQPDNNQMGFVMADTGLLLFKNDDAYHHGFVNHRAFAEVRKLSEEFNRIWEHGDSEPSLRILHI
ncbi:hypothetical protein [Gilvimarinus chinensis]|uniref:DUF7931 domain-containing protein n=1 Tax=Gilvimarinus chinensis TaxID=396005 RepID=UPI000376161E|nr:hypothetical protein [Gilvimarinus chinensis]